MSTVTIPTEGMPAIITLDTDHIACLSCGVAVPLAEGRNGMEAFGTTLKEMTPGDRRGGYSQAPAVLMSRCTDCRAIHAHAETLLTEHPGVGHSIGSRSLALQRIESALAGVDVLGQPAPTIRSSRDLRLLIEHVAAGAGVNWSRAFVNRTWRDPATVPKTCASARWAHVEDEHRQILRDSLAAFMRARIERPRMFAPPADADRDGCLFCGIREVEALPSQSYEAWRSVTVTPSRIGGRLNAERLDGYLCRTCDLATETEPALGATAMEQSLRRHLGVVQRGLASVELVNVVGWGVLDGAPANARPWGHLGDLEAIRKLLEG